MRLFVFLCVFVALSKGLIIEEDFEILQKGLVDLFEYGEIPEEYREVFSRNPLPGLFRDNDKIINDPLVCILCEQTVNLVLQQIQQQETNRTFLENVLVDICLSSNMEDERVCSGGIDINIDILMYILNNKNDSLLPKDVCGVFLTNSGCVTTDPDWSINIDTGAPTEAKIPNFNSEKIHILHITDVHYDPFYEAYSNADCGEPICCHGDQGSPDDDDDENVCGYWSEYKPSDTPWALVEETVRHVLESEKEIDLIYFTGDVITHSFWYFSDIQDNIKWITKFYDYFKTNFNVPVIPVLGNHETLPLNAYAPSGINDTGLSVNWLYELIANEWEYWLGTDVQETLLKDGYYTVTPFEGFRVIVLNDNLCYTLNWWLIWSTENMFEQLQWLADTLKLAEDRGESVHLLYHIPMGHPQCINVWQREFNRIINRFSNIITGQFNGHTHYDQINFFYNESDYSQAIGVAFNGASLVTFVNNNPSYKYYTVDQSTFHLLDYEEWTFNLTEANFGNNTRPNWYKLYSFVELYGVSDLRAASANVIVDNMAKNHSLILDYIRLKHRNSDPGILEAINCDETCQKEELCTITTSLTRNTGPCEYYQNIYDENK